MFLHVISAYYVDHYKLEIQFNNGRIGIVDLADSLTGKIFESLQDLVLFQKFIIDPELGTIRWSNAYWCRKLFGASQYTKTRLINRMLVCKRKKQL